MNPNYDVLTILRIAKYYYIDELSQQEIALKENIHRTQISRLLKIAREEGFVKIEISAPDSTRAYELSRRLEDKLHLNQVMVTPELPLKKIDSQSADDALTFFAARYIEKWVPKFNKIGVGVGKTLYQTTANISAHPSDNNMDFYAVSGHVGTDNPYLQSTIICDRLASAFGGKVHYNNYSMVTNTNHLSDIDKSKLNAMQEEFKHLDAVLVSVGGQFALDYPYFTEFYDQVKDFNIQKVFSRPHANVLGNVYYEDGRRLSLPEPFRMTSMNADDIQKNPHVLCIARGSHKVRPVIFAAKYGYINELVTDEYTARLILEELQKMKEAEATGTPAQSNKTMAVK